MRQPEFLLLVAAMTLGGFCVYSVVVNLVPLLAQNGLSTAEAAVALGIGGAGQVAGRLFYGPLLTRVTARARTIATLAAASVTTLALAVVHQPVAVVCALSFAAGMARGIYTLIQATAVSDRWGTHEYGARSGILSGGVLPPQPSLRGSAPCSHPLWGATPRPSWSSRSVACWRPLVRPHRK